MNDRKMILVIIGTVIGIVLVTSFGLMAQSIKTERDRFRASKPTCPVASYAMAHKGKWFCEARPL